MAKLTLKQPSQRAQEKLASMLRTKRLKDAKVFIKSFKLFKDDVPLPVKLSIHKDLNKIRRREQYDFGAQHINVVLREILGQKAYKKQIKPGVKRYGLNGE
jgi:hypothetical protein